MLKKLRYYYWLLIAFIRKNIKFLVVSFILGFFAIILFLHLFPFLQSVLFRERIVIGVAGNYTVKTLPIDILRQVSNPLVSVNEEGELIPVLAHSYEVLDEGKVYRFHLKNNLYWADGDHFTAGDTEYDFKDVKVHVVDDYTLDFQLNQPLVIFPNYLSRPITKHPMDGIGGLYRVQSIKVTKNIVDTINLIPNKDNLPYQVYRFYKSDDDLLTAYKKGEITEFTTSKKSVADLFVDWRNTKVVKDIDYDQIMTLFFNTENPLLLEKDIRKAVVYGIAPFDENGQAATGPIPPTSWAYDTKGIRQYSQNIERAQTLLKSNRAGTQEARLTLNTFFDHASIAEEIKKSLEQVGFTIELKLLSYIPQDFDMMLTIWNPPLDPDQYFFWHSTQKDTNITRYKNVKVDKLLEDGRRIISAKQRKALANDFQKAIMDEVPAVFLYYPFVYTIQRK